MSLLANKCDRCGVLYEKYENINDENINGFIFVDSDEFHRYYQRGGIKDLCPKCLKELMDWFNMSEEKNDE